MATSRVKTSSILQGFPKSRSLLAGNTAFNPSSFESIATVVGTGSAATLTFTSIPSTYKHLQIRGIGKITPTGQRTGMIRVQLNTDTGANYASHRLIGDGTNATGSSGTSETYMYARDSIAASMASPTNMSNIVGALIIDIHDYASTTKTKTIKGIAGVDGNYTSLDFEINLWSGVWNSTAAITSVSMVSSDPFTALTSYALYGIKG